MQVKTDNGLFEINPKHITHLIQVGKSHTHLVLIDNRIIQAIEPIKVIRDRRESELIGTR